MIVKLPFDLPVHSAAAIGAYLYRTHGAEWRVEPGQHTDVIGMQEPGKSILLKRIAWIIDDQVERRRL